MFPEHEPAREAAAAEPTVARNTPGRVEQLANLLGDMPGEPFLRRPTSHANVFDTLTTEEAARIWPVFEEAQRQFRHLLLAQRIWSIPDADLWDIQLEGAAKAVRNARDGRLTPAFMSNSMKFELARYWRRRERRTMVSIDDPNSNGGRRAAPGLDINLLRSLSSLAKKRIFFAVKFKGVSARWLSKRLMHHNQQPYTIREVKRLLKRAQSDIRFIISTGQDRDREIEKALEKCVPDDRGREAMQLYLTKGLSMRQLGQKYGVSPVAVYKWIKKGKGRLIPYLRQHRSKALLQSVLAQFGT